MFPTTSRSMTFFPIRTGITRPLQVDLELDGVRARGAFRSVDINKRRQRLRDGQVFYNFRDTYRNEIAAYHLSRVLDETMSAPQRKLARQVLEGLISSQKRRLNSHVHRDDSRVRPSPEPAGHHWHCFFFCLF